ncbi:unnamed protein product [Pararhodospirillum photometricum DSM 122]|uniref:Uncharacterized protein n=1 Tax=Pararhodospirillum photometricum DSM 122 TaxID=1150469 RepID=H6SJW3_PARPM|nr:unnamed protein product [Pararhodospirillum photometricum DSM 122]
MTSKAAPGVDHAVMMGARVRQDKTMAESPDPSETAQIHDDICA